MKILLSILVFILVYYIGLAIILFILFCLPHVNVKVTDFKSGLERKCVGMEKIKFSFIAGFLWPMVVIQTIKNKGE